MKQLIITGTITMLITSGILYLMFPDYQLWIIPFAGALTFGIFVPLLIGFVFTIAFVCDKLKEVLRG